MRIGIDVGGTNTDAVLMSGTEVLAAAKRPTSSDVLQGVLQSIGAVLEASGVSGDDVLTVMIGTTHFTNAVVERRGLASTAVLRLGLPATASVPPFEDWPDDLRDALGGRWALAHGGSEFDGRVLSPVDLDEVDGIVAAWEREGVRAVAVSAVFSPVYPDAERQVVEHLTEAFPTLSIVGSAEIGGIGILERENAAAMNAALMPLAHEVVESFRRGAAELTPRAGLFITQNDGTLIDAATAERFPVLTFASGPTNSMRGAAFLSGVDDALVLDVGGTTSDIGALVAGFPRASAVAATFADVRTNFRMPDLVSFGLGGGTRIRDEGARLGPDSVGYRITAEALVFGGDTLTATDVAVAAGRAQVGDASAVAGLDPALVERALAEMTRLTEDALDRVRLSRDEQSLIVVGGGSILVPDELAGASRVIRPPHFDVANAVGAAIAQVSGTFDAVVPVDRPRSELLSSALDEATRRAVEAGAAPDSVRTVELEDIPVAYVDGAMTRVRARVVGDLAAANPVPAAEKEPR